MSSRVSILTAICGPYRFSSSTLVKNEKKPCCGTKVALAKYRHISLWGDKTKNQNKDINEKNGRSSVLPNARWLCMYIASQQHSNHTECKYEGSRHDLECKQKDEAFNHSKLAYLRGLGEPEVSRPPKITSPHISPNQHAPPVKISLIKYRSLVTMSTALHLLYAFLCSYLVLSPTASELCNPTDKKVLLSIKKALNNPYVTISWDADTDCCLEWNNVECDKTSNRIDSLRLVSGNLPVPVEIPDAIGDLPYLDTLTLHKQDNLTGPIPYAITKLKNLRYLELTWNNLTGPVPPFLSELKNLLFLHLSHNNLSGSIPRSLSTFPHLSSIRLDRNKLTGTIPASLSAIKGNNLYLILSHNNLTGKIPASFKDTDFGQVDLSRNKLEGDISMFFGPNKRTPIMDFSRNQFEFNMSNLEVFDMISLDLNHNKVNGSIPRALTGLTNLQIFNVSYNRLCGQIPVGGKLQSFDYTAYFHNRCLCGSPLNVTCS